MVELPEAEMTTFPEVKALASEVRSVDKLSMHVFRSTVARMGMVLLPGTRTMLFIRPSPMIIPPTIIFTVTFP